MRPTQAIVRGIPETYNEVTYLAYRAYYERARIQHKAYVDTLKALGVEITELQPLKEYPDCCFVQDCAIVAGNKIIDWAKIIAITPEVSTFSGI